MQTDQSSVKRSAIAFAILFTLFEFSLLDGLFNYLSASAVV
jgi:hypothetical protein